MRYLVTFIKGLAAVTLLLAFLAIVENAQLDDDLTPCNFCERTAR